MRSCLRERGVGLPPTPPNPPRSSLHGSWAHPSNLVGSACDHLLLGRRQGSLALCPVSSPSAEITGSRVELSKELAGIASMVYSHLLQGLVAIVWDPLSFIWSHFC